MIYLIIWSNNNKIKKFTAIFVFKNLSGSEKKL